MYGRVGRQAQWESKNKLNAHNVYFDFYVSRAGVFARDLNSAQSALVSKVACPLWVKADMCNAPTHVRFTPNSDRKSGHLQNVMSALP
jgi:hypothetical protein